MRKHILLFCILFSVSILSQSKKVTKYLKEQDDQYKKEFPPTLTNDFPKESLGYKLQEMYQTQAQKVCGIKRNGKRMYIPQEITLAYDEKELRKKKIYSLPISSKNLLFLALTEKEINEIKLGTYFNSHSFHTQHIIGFNDPIINFGESKINPINGFPSFFFKKSCGNYFNGNLDFNLNAPLAIAELKSSLNADTQQSSSITTITGKFISPLSQLFKENSKKSIYTHLLLWEIYYNQAKNANFSDPLLIHSGKYISEFDATLSKIALTKEQNLHFNNILTSNIAYGIVNFNGEIQAGINRNTSFKLEDFDTSIHRHPNNTLKFTTAILPSTDEINNKLQNSIDDQSSFEDTYLSHLTPVQFSKTLVGIPSFLCEKNSWIINGYENDIWEGKPNVTSFSNINKQLQLPECICEITGYFKKEAINEAVKNKKSTLKFNLSFNHIKIIRNQKLSFNFSESVRVTDSPKILHINPEIINSNKKIETTSDHKIFYQYPIEFIIDDTKELLKIPYELSEVQLTHFNDNKILSLQNDQPERIRFNTFKLVLKTEPKDQNFYEITDKELTAPIEIKFKVKLKDETKIELITNKISLQVPSLIPKTLDSNSE